MIKLINHLKACVISIVVVVLIVGGGLLIHSLGRDIIWLIPICFYLALHAFIYSNIDRGKWW